MFWKRKGNERADHKIADEPTGALDSGTGDRIIKFLISYAHQFQKTILLVTHDMDIALQCDRVIEMSDGKIEEKL